MSRIFLSHSSTDNAHAIAMRDWLAQEGWDDVFLDLDADRGIVAGDRWERRLHEAANRCEAVIFLVSSAWLKSEWCLREFHLAEKLNKRIFSVVIGKLKKADLPADVTRTWQFVDLAQGQDHDLFRVMLPDGEESHVTCSRSGLARLRNGLTRSGLDPRFFAWPPEGDRDRPPYRGMRPMEAEDAGIFFGREAPTIEALDRLRGLSEAAPPRLFVILGASGAGKSSFLRAGLWPRLQRDDRFFLPLPIVRPERAVQSGETGLIQSIEQACRGRAVKRSRAEIRKALEAGVATAAQLLAELAQAAKPADSEAAPTLVLAVDQAEELFQAAGRAESEAFLRLLAGLAMAATPRCIIVFTIRSDAYEPLQTAKAFEGLTQVPFSLSPIPTGAWGAVIEGPARRMTRAGRKLAIEPALTHRLLADLEAGGGKDALPLLAFTLERLFTEYGGDGDLKLAEYEEFGGVSGAIDAAVKQAMAAADGDSRVPPDAEARKALLRRALIPWLSGIDPDTGSPRRFVARLSEIPEEARPLVEHLVNARLLSTDGDLATGNATIEPAHEALLRQWSLLNGWLVEDAGSLASLEAVRRATRDWLANNRDRAWLNHRASRLDDAERLHHRPDLAAKLDAEDREYLAACRKSENAEREKARLVAEREIRSARRTRIAAVAAAVCACLAGLAALYAFNKAGEARRQAEEAQIQRTEAANQKVIAEERAAQVLSEGKRTSQLLDISRAYSMLEDTPQEALALATASVAELERSGHSQIPFVYFFFSQIVNRARELPLNQFYTDYSFGKLKFVVTQPDNVLGVGERLKSEATGSCPILIGSRNLVGAIDSQGRPVGKPIGSLDYRLFANDATWIYSHKFVLATGNWKDDTASTQVAENATLQIHDLDGARTKLLLQDHDAPITSVATAETADGHMLVLAGDSRGQLIEILPNGTSLEIIPTGVDREIIRIFPGMGYGRSVVVFGRSMEAQGETGVPAASQQATKAEQRKNAERRLAEALGYMKAGEETADVVDTDTIRWVGAESGVNCAAQLPDDALAICTRHGTIQIWELLDLSQLSGIDGTGAERKPTVEFSPFSSTPIDILAIPGTPALAVASSDGIIGLYSRDGQQIAVFPATNTSRGEAVGKLGFLPARRLLFGIPDGFGLRAWDTADIIDLKRKMPADLDAAEVGLRQLGLENWLLTGSFALPDVSSKIRLFRDGGERPSFDFLSRNRRFLYGFGEASIVYADQSSGVIAEMKLPNDAELPGHATTNPEWYRNRTQTSVLEDGSLCIMDSVTNYAVAEGSSAEVAHRMSLVNLVRQERSLEVMLKEPAEPYLLQAVEVDAEPACAYATGTSIKLLTKRSTATVELREVAGHKEGLKIVSHAVAPEARALLLLIHPESTGTDQANLISVSLDAPHTVHSIGKVSLSSKLLATSLDGRRFLVGSTARGNDSQISEIRLLDETLGAIVTLPKQLNGASGFTFSEDGSSLRTILDGEAIELPLSIGSLLSTAKKRQAAWAEARDREAVLQEIGDCARESDWGRCRETLSGARERFPSDPTVLLWSGNSQDRDTPDKAAAALAFYDASIKEDPFGFIAHYQKSQLLWQLGRFEDALAEYEYLISLPENIPSFDSDGSWGSADPIVQAVLSATRQIVNAKRANLILHRARALSELRKWDEALADVALIHEMGRDTAESFQIKAESLAGTGELHEALEAYRLGLEDFRGNPDQGWIHLPDNTTELRAWQHYKEAELLAATAELQGRLSSQAESEALRLTAREMLSLALNSDDRTEFVSRLASALLQTLETVSAQ